MNNKLDFYKQWKKSVILVVLALLFVVGGLAVYATNSGIQWAKADSEISPYNLLASHEDINKGRMIGWDRDEAPIYASFGKVDNVWGYDATGQPILTEPAILEAIGKNGLPVYDYSALDLARTRDKDSDIDWDNIITYDEDGSPVLASKGNDANTLAYKSDGQAIYKNSVNLVKYASIDNVAIWSAFSQSDIDAMKTAINGLHWNGSKEDLIAQIMNNPLLSQTQKALLVKMLEGMNINSAEDLERAKATICKMIDDYYKAAMNNKSTLGDNYNNISPQPAVYTNQSSSGLTRADIEALINAAKGSGDTDSSIIEMLNKQNEANTEALRKAVEELQSSQTGDKQNLINRINQDKDLTKEQQNLLTQMINSLDGKTAGNISALKAALTSMINEYAKSNTDALNAYKDEQRTTLSKMDSNTQSSIKKLGDDTNASLNKLRDDTNSSLNRLNSTVEEYNQVYTVTFKMGTVNGRDQGTYLSERIKYNLSVYKPADPSIPGYKFTGWYTESGNEYNFGAPITEDLTLVAHWRPLYTATVTFDWGLNSTMQARLAPGSGYPSYTLPQSTDNTVNGTMTVTEGQGYGSGTLNGSLSDWPDVPSGTEVAGYYFMGWYNGDTLVKPYSTVELSQNGTTIALTGRWSSAEKAYYRINYWKPVSGTNGTIQSTDYAISADPELKAAYAANDVMDASGNPPFYGKIGGKRYQLVSVVAGCNNDGTRVTFPVETIEGTISPAPKSATVSKDGVVICNYLYKSVFSYTVTHWLQDLAAARNGHTDQTVSNYTSDENVYSGTIDEGGSVRPAARNYQGFTAPVPTDNLIETNGQDIPYYYTRNQYTLTVKADEEQVLPGELCKIGKVSFTETFPTDGDYSGCTPVSGAYEGTAATADIYYGMPITVKASNFTTGYELQGYIVKTANSEYFASGTDLASDGSYTFNMPNENCEVQAVHQAKAYNIIYSANGGTGTMGPDVFYFNDYIKYTNSNGRVIEVPAREANIKYAESRLSDNTYTSPENKHFIGWGLSPNGPAIWGVRNSSDGRSFALNEGPNGDLNGGLANGTGIAYNASDDDYNAAAHGNVELGSSKNNANVTWLKEMEGSTVRGQGLSNDGTPVTLYAIWQQDAYTVTIANKSLTTAADSENRHAYMGITPDEKKAERHNFVNDGAYAPETANIKGIKDADVSIVYGGETIAMPTKTTKRVNVGDTVTLQSIRYNKTTVAGHCYADDLWEYNNHTTGEGEDPVWNTPPMYKDYTYTQNVGDRRRMQAYDVLFDNLNGLTIDGITYTSAGTGDAGRGWGYSSSIAPTDLDFQDPDDETRALSFTMPASAVDTAISGSLFVTGTYLQYLYQSSQTVYGRYVYQYTYKTDHDGDGRFNEDAHVYKCNYCNASGKSYEGHRLDNDIHCTNRVTVIEWRN